MSDGGLREKELIKQFLIIVRESGFLDLFRGGQRHGVIDDVPLPLLCGKRSSASR